MESSDDSDDEETLDKKEAKNSSIIKPQIASIFTEVEQNLPSIDFDDLSSDSDITDEPLIFHRNLKSSDYLTDEDKDLDTCLGAENVIDKPGGLSPFNNKDNSELSSPELRSDDFVLHGDFQISSFSNWEELERDMSDDQSRSIETCLSQIVSASNGLTSSNGAPGQTKTTETKSNEEDKKEKKEEVFTPFYYDKQTPVLPLNVFDSIDFDSVLDNLNEDSQYTTPPRVPRPAWFEHNLLTSQKGSGDDHHTTGDEKTLIEKLAQLSAKQGATGLAEVNPQTGATVHDNRSIYEENKGGNKWQTQSAVDKECVAATKTNCMGTSTSCMGTSTSCMGTSTSCMGTSTSCMGTSTSCMGTSTSCMGTSTSCMGTSTSCMGTSTSSMGTSTSSVGTNMGTNTNDLPPASVKSGTSKSDTVFIDLRGFEKHREEEKQNIERVQTILQIQNKREQQDSSDSEDDADKWIKERRRIKQKLISQGTSTGLTQLSPNKHRSPTSKTAYKQPQRVINMSNKSKPIQTDSMSSGSQTFQMASKTQLDEETQKRQQVAQAEKQRQMEVARKLREAKEKEQEHRLKLMNRLESLRPTASVSGLQSAAEATPTLYDIEASFEPGPHALPTVMSSEQNCLLLKIHLACNGEIILHKTRTSQSVDTGDGLSASYTTLLTWLASLVPDNFTFIQRAEGDRGTDDEIVWQPFYVVGLQQMWLDEKLYLTVAITPTQKFDPKSILSVKSKKYQGGNPFMQHVHNFLTSNTLLSVCPWLQGLVSMEVKGPEQEDYKPYIYCPPLPNVTDKSLASFIEVHQDPQAASRMFKMSVGYYWQTVDTEERLHDQELTDDTISYDTQITMSLVYKKIFRDPSSLMGIMIRLLQEGLDLAGVRLLYPPIELLNKHADKETISKTSELEFLNNVGPVLALSIRGTFARNIWLDAIGPSDPVLARRTDPNSLCAQFGGDSREECLLFCPRNSNRVLSEIARWFGGRIPAEGSFEVGKPYQRKCHLQSANVKNKKCKKGLISDIKLDDEDILTQRPVATLTATTKSDLFLVVSPLFLPSAVGILISTCQRRGFQIRGVKRVKLSTKKADNLGMCSKDYPVFMGDCIEDCNDYPAMVFLLEKENSIHNAASLIEAFMVQLTLTGLMDIIQERYSENVSSKKLFYAASFSEDILMNLGGDFCKCPDYDTLCGPSYVRPTLHSNAELEQIVIVILHGYNIQKSSGLFIGQLLNVIPYSRTPVISPLSQGLELLGLKWLSSLSTSQAKEVTPIEVGDRMWKESIHRLTSEPAIVLALRGVNAFKQLESMVPPGILNQPNKTPLHKLMSHTPDEAYTFCRLFFSKYELFQDNTARTVLPYLPEALQYTKKTHQENKEDKKTTLNIFDIMKKGPQPIRTFLLIKPGAIKKHSLAKLLKKIVQEGFRVVGLRLEVLDKQKVDLLVKSEEALDKEIITKHKEHLRSGPVVVMCLERENAVYKLLEILGPNNPQSARRQSQFLWRGIFGSDAIANGLYGSVDYCQAIEDLSLFFTESIITPLDYNQQQPKILEDDIIDINYKLHREVEIDNNSQRLSYEDSNMADIHASLLLQTNCIVLAPPLFGLTPKSKSQGYVEIIDLLQSHGFDIVGARMFSLSQNQAEQFLCLNDAGSFKQVPILLMGPCLVLAVQRDNAVIAFNSILESNAQGDSLLKKYNQFILRCTTVSQVHRLLPFFFEELMPGSQISIKQKNTVET